ncbi:hypothetical protein SAPIO_CDS10839 [Scedosporium apiospermum]|uniref:Uncharacterized protein n=1 Tax=Pseudallescheria apiosperma TaxID=563466 RepID=A0A084FUN7_PSEDA|nr:uncharacterized protein SAPIO_CDS10839 [Scedosporium apiospermum]KEZ38799.1 hypothetical protein SAPIO_CDS10839 [Scedosporium apiospermum]
MSAIASRAIIRAATRRQVSTLRAAARSMESHPFEKLPATQKVASGAYGKMAKSAATRLAFFFPGIALLLGWPYLSKVGLDGHVQ